MLGVAIATAIHFFCRFLFSYLLVQHYDKDTAKCYISLWHEDSWKSLNETLWTGINSFLLKVMGWWAFDVFTQLATQISYTNNKYTAAQTILRNIGLFTFMIPVGLGFAANYIIGKNIGQQKPVTAKKSYKLIM